MKNKLNNFIKFNRCFIIAEIGLAHEGSLGIALAMIEKAKKCGVDAVKFQTHIAEYESSKYEKFRVNSFYQDKTRFDYWKRTSFNINEWKIIKKKCDDLKIIFLSTPFSIESASILKKVGIKLWKVSSGDINNFPLLEYLKDTNLPILLSSGMSGYDEISNAINFLEKTKENLLLFQCTNSYPCKAKDIGFNQIKILNDKYNIPIGLSDHSGNIASSIAAFTLGAKAVEVHVTWSKDYFGPDVSSSLTFDELKILVDSIRFLQKGLFVKKSKNILIKSHKKTRELFMKGIYINKDLRIGDILKRSDFSFKKPLIGIPASDYKIVAGKKLIKEIKKGEPLKIKYFEKK